MKYLVLVIIFPMIAFAKTPDLVDYIYTPLSSIPKWGLADIHASHKILVKSGSLPEKPTHKANLLNMFLVIEAGEHHILVLDEDKLEVIHRFKSQYALHVEPKFSPDRRFAYLTSRDGWVSKFDMYSLQIVAEVRAGINTRNIAISGDGRSILVANYLPHSLVLLDADNLQPIKIIQVVNDKGKSSRVSAVYTAAPQNSFIVALKDFKQVWQINYEKNPPPGFGEWVHDYNEKSGEAEAVKFPIRKINLDLFLDDFFFTRDYVQIIGRSRQGKVGVIDLDIGRIIVNLDLEGMPHLESSSTWKYKGRTILATPDLEKSQTNIVDMSNWKIIKKIKTQGPSFFVRSHENSQYAWTNVFFGPNKDVVHVVDKNTLEITKTFKPMPGKTVADVKFNKDGKYAFLNISGMGGVVLVYDANTLKLIKKISMLNLLGKNKVHNKRTYSVSTAY